MGDRDDAHNPSARCAGTSPRFAQGGKAFCQRFFSRSFFQYSRRFRISRSKPRSTGW